MEIAHSSVVVCLINNLALKFICGLLVGLDKLNFNARSKHAVTKNPKILTRAFLSNSDPEKALVFYMVTLKYVETWVASNITEPSYKT